jgi:hypothetical protein
MQLVKLLDNLSTKYSVYSRSILSIFLSIILVLLQSCHGVDKYGAATPDRIVEQYLLALEDRDRNLVVKLLPENASVENQIRSKINKFGGYKIKERKIEYIKSKPTLWTIKIQGVYVDRSDTRRKFDETIVIEYQSKGQVKQYGGRWYLKL